IVDRHTLQTINFLNLINKISSQSLNTQNTQNIMGHRISVHKKLTLLHEVALEDRHVTSLWYQIFNRFNVFIQRHHLNTTLRLVILTKLYPSINLTDDGKVFWNTRFEKLRHTRQTTGNITCLRRLSRNT